MCAVFSTVTAQTKVISNSDNLPDWIKNVGARTAPKASKVFWANNFGANGDGKTILTSAIQKAIDGNGKKWWDKYRTLRNVNLQTSFGNKVEIKNSENVESPNVKKQIEGIKATVTGKLQFQEGRGYFILVRDSQRNWESKVWLRVSENRILINKLQGLIDKTVMANGELGQLPENVTASVPPNGIYLQSFEIEGV